MIEYLKELDIQLFLQVNACHNTFWDTIMWWLSDKFIWLPLYLLIIGAIIKRYKKQSIYIVGALILSVVITDLVSVHFFKEVFQRYRPSHNLDLQGMVHFVNDYKGGMFGFVSSHASDTFCLAVFSLLIFKNQKYTISILLWASIVSYSRIYLGVHYPADIVGGMLLGSAIGGTVFFLYKKFISISLSSI